MPDKFTVPASAASASASASGFGWLAPPGTAGPAALTPVWLLALCGGHGTVQQRALCHLQGQPSFSAPRSPSQRLGWPTQLLSRMLFPGGTRRGPRSCLSSAQLSPASSTSCHVCALSAILFQERTTLTASSCCFRSHCSSSSKSCVCGSELLSGSWVSPPPCAQLFRLWVISCFPATRLWLGVRLAGQAQCQPRNVSLTSSPVSSRTTFCWMGLAFICWSSFITPTVSPLLSLLASLASRHSQLKEATMEEGCWRPRKTPAHWERTRRCVKGLLQAQMATSPSPSRQGLPIPGV